MLKFFNLFFLVFSINIFAENTYVSCTSASGKSVYDLALPADDELMGEIRLRFDDQDILYSAKIKIVTPTQLIGVAKYKASRSGHQDAKSWVFTYNSKKKTLIDDGRLSSTCK